MPVYRITVFLNCTWRCISTAYPRQDLKWGIIYYSEQYVNTIPESTMCIIHYLSNNTMSAGNNMALPWKLERHPVIQHYYVAVCVRPLALKEQTLWQHRMGRDLQSDRNNNSDFKKWPLDPNRCPFLTPAQPALLQLLRAYVSGTVNAWTVRANLIQATIIRSIH